MNGNHIRYETVEYYCFPSHTDIQKVIDQRETLRPKTIKFQKENRWKASRHWVRQWVLRCDNKNYLQPKKKKDKLEFDQS